MIAIDSTVFAVLLALLFGGAAIGLGVLGVRAINARHKTGKPEDQLFEALKSYIHLGILAGERSVIWAMDDFSRRINASDRKAVANAVYALIPERITVGGIVISKNTIPEDQFEAYVRRVYDGMNAALEANKTFLVSRIKAEEEADKSLSASLTIYKTDGNKSGGDTVGGNISISNDAGTVLESDMATKS